MCDTADVTVLETIVTLKFKVSQVPVKREASPLTREANEPHENMHVTAEECMSLSDLSERCLL